MKPVSVHVQLPVLPENFQDNYGQEIFPSSPSTKTSPLHLPRQLVLLVGCPLWPCTALPCTMQAGMAELALLYIQEMDKNCCCFPKNITKGSVSHQFNRGNVIALLIVFSSFKFLEKQHHLVKNNKFNTKFVTRSMLK